MRTLFVAILFLMTLAACTLEEATPSGGGDSSVEGQEARVSRVIDGDTIDVVINGETFRVRYVGMNTPERDEPCYGAATQANRDLVEGQTVILQIDTSDTDRFDRLLRYIYVGNTFVNEELVRQGYAEVVRYNPDDREYENFRDLEQEAARQNIGCHPTGIFDDDTTTR